MKQFFINVGVVSFLCLSLFASCQNKTTTSKIENSDKKIIKTIELYSIKGENGEKVHSGTKTFDENGNLMKVVTFSEGEKTEIRYKYDENGNLITSADYDGDGDELSKYHNTYKGNLLVEEKTPYEKINYTYDDKGNLIKEVVSDSDGNEEKTTKKEYEYEGENIVKIMTFEKRNALEFKPSEVEFFTYDKNGKLVKEKSVARFGEWLYEYAYHSNGNLKQKTTLAYENTEKIVCIYNETGQRIEEEIFRRKSTEEEFTLDLTNKWSYNDNGDLILYQGIRKGKAMNQKLQEITYFD